MQRIPHSRRDWLRLLGFLFAAYLLVTPVATFLGAFHTASKFSGAPTFVAHGSEAHWNYGVIAYGLAGYLTIVSAFVCTLRLYRYSGRVTKPLPVVSKWGSEALIFTPSTQPRQ